MENHSNRKLMSKIKMVKGGNGHKALILLSKSKNTMCFAETKITNFAFWKLLLGKLSQRTEI